MNKRRALQIVLIVVMGFFLAEMFTPLHAASCHTTIGKKDSKTTEISAHGTIAADAPVSFQIHGGDNVFLDGLRAAFKDQLHAAWPEAKFVDGPPPKDAVLMRMTLTAADLRWTPFYSHEGLGVHTTIQLPGTKSGTQITADSDVDAVCTGLVARSHFQSHTDTIAPLAGWLVDELMDARKK